ncbi:4,5-dihydroxyphthalate decarboxylase [Rhodobacteraceae bacterium WD3A24]|nr:4,5-dihydroxyphthalate decarboxylase [Rhodobacteraceae bacterium WD3A24]
MLTLSLATWDHDRAMPLHDGRVTLPGVALESHVLPTSDLFPIAVQEARFDITELSVSSYALQLSRGDSEYTAVPVFLSRAFRHNGFFVRAGSDIDDPAALAGRSVGVPEYQMTAALWMRGILADDYGVTPASVRWRTGALDSGIRRERLTLELPEGMVVEPIEDGETLQDLLLAGEIDAVLAAKPPAAFLDGDPRIRRLFPDFEAAEREYHARTGFFPIMHVLALRRSLAEEHPWLPRALYDAGLAARDMAMARLRDIWLGSANRLTLPWLGANMEATLEAMGPDYWSYGFTANRAELDAICRYSAEQHLAVRRLSPEEMFHHSVLET